MYREYNRSYYNSRSDIGAVEIIIIINIVFFLPYISYRLFQNPMLLKLLYQYCALNINIKDTMSVETGAVWQFVTAMFTHGGFFHILFNMYGLYIFGKPLEAYWGTKRFTAYYLTTGILANIASYFIFKLSYAPVLLMGASGAIFAILLAFAAYSPDTLLLLFFFIPMKVKWAILLFAGIELISEISNAPSGIAHITHLLGFVFGFLYLLIFFKKNAVKEMYFPNRNNIYYR
ncbi:MAG: rhomboid family intramembrane serine protease [Spirochaetes bacterium]|nr:rhomboid family intramembrane serine protease [Spirochaetota bacterium]